jgi:hypothetical protein
MSKHLHNLYCQVCFQTAVTCTHSLSHCHPYGVLQLNRSRQRRLNQYGQHISSSTGISHVRKFVVGTTERCHTGSTCSRCGHLQGRMACRLGDGERCHHPHSILEFSLAWQGCTVPLVCAWSMLEALPADILRIYSKCFDRSTWNEMIPS